MVGADPVTAAAYFGDDLLPAIPDVMNGVSQDRSDN
jgi:hypothetical protein